MDKLIYCQGAVLAGNLLDEGVDPKQPIRIRLANGEVINGVFHGYWDLRPIKEPEVAVSRPIEGGQMTTGMLRPGEEILDPIPSFEEWSAQGQIAA